MRFRFPGILQGTRFCSPLQGSVTYDIYWSADLLDDMLTNPQKAKYALGKMSSGRSVTYNIVKGMLRWGFMHTFEAFLSITEYLPNKHAKSHVK